MSDSTAGSVTIIFPGHGKFLSDSYYYADAVVTPQTDTPYAPAVIGLGGGYFEQASVVSQTYSGASYDVVINTNSEEAGEFGNPPAGNYEYKGTFFNKGQDTLTFSTISTTQLYDYYEALTITPPANSGYGSVTVDLGYKTYSAYVLTETDSGPNYSVEVFTQSADVIDDSFVETLSGTLPVSSTALPCYVRGTFILTTRGEVPVESLRLGDRLVIVEGDRNVSLVQWIGHCSVKPLRHANPSEVKPVRIRAGALGENQPDRDLLVSPGHRMHLDGCLIRAIDLVNHSTIVQEDVEAVEYWHIELASHFVMIANGCEAESYQDTGNRASFDGEAARMLRPVIDGDALRPCRPFAMPSVALRERLIGRAEALGWVRSSASFPCLDVDGLLIEPEVRGNRLTFALPFGCTEARLRSRAATPAFTDAGSGDLRRLGLRVTRISLLGVAETLDVALEDALLGEGFSHAERDAGGRAWRWTDGDAVLPISALNGGRDVVAVEVILGAQTLRYWEEPGVVEMLEVAA